MLLGLITLVILRVVHLYLFEHYRITWLSQLFLAGSSPSAFFNTYVGLTSTIFLCVLWIARAPLLTQPRIFALPALSLCLGLYLCLWGLGESSVEWADYCRGAGVPLKVAMFDCTLGIGAAFHAARIGAFYATCSLMIILFARINEK